MVSSWSSTPVSSQIVYSSTEVFRFTSQAVLVVLSVGMGMALRSTGSGASILETLGPQSAKPSAVIMSGDS